MVFAVPIFSEGFELLYILLGYELWAALLYIIKLLHFNI